MGEETQGSERWLDADVRRWLGEHDVRLDHLESEMLRTRGRIHDIESDRNAIRLLAATTKELGEKIKELADGVDAIAERAVEHVLRRRRDETRDGWRYFLAWATAAVAVAAFLVERLHWI